MARFGRIRAAGKKVAEVVGKATAPARAKARAAVRSYEAGKMGKEVAANEAKYSSDMKSKFAGLDAAQKKELRAKEKAAREAGKTPEEIKSESRKWGAEMRKKYGARRINNDTIDRRTNATIKKIKSTAKAAGAGAAATAVGAAVGYRRRRRSAKRNN